MEIKWYLVRHGETQANADQIIQGQSDWDLNERGRQQAAAAGKALADVPFNAVLSSDLARPLQTAEEIVKENRHFSGEVLQWKSLRERSYGVLERRPNTELKEAAAAAGVDVMRYTPEGGETLDQMFVRIKGFFADFVGFLRSMNKDEATVLVVSHGGTIAAILRYLAAEQRCFFASGQENWRRPAGNTSVTRFSMKLESDSSSAKVSDLVCDELFSCQHLDSVGAKSCELDMTV